MSSDGTGRENLTKLSSVAFPTFELAVNYRSMALAPDGRMVAVCSAPDWNRREYHGKIGVWRTGDWSAVITPQLDVRSGVNAIAFSPDGHYLAGAGYDESIYIWDVSNWTLARRFFPMSGPIYSLSFSPDGADVAAADQLSHITIWTFHVLTAAASPSHDYVRSVR